jgi:flagellar motility protein MotE (MotC chaperone)
MKTLWNIVSFIAIVNLLALVFLVGWLVANDRLNLDRARSIRTMLASTVAAETAEAEARAAQEEVDRAAAAAEAIRRDPPLPSAVQVERALLVGDRTRQALNRLQDETAQHRRELDRRATLIDDRETHLAQRKQAWEDNIREEAARRDDEQFRKTVTLYETVPAKQAKQMLVTLVGKGETRQAVAYIDAMSPRAAGKILKELKTDAENELATELLERLRIFGTDAEAEEFASNDATLSDAR